MKRKPHSASLVLLLICIFTFWWGISVLSQSAIPVTVTSNSESPANVGTDVNAVVVHESVSGSTYSYSGTYTPKSACDSFGSGIRYSSEGNGHVSVLLIAKPAGAACAQAAGDSLEEPFSVSIKLEAGSNPTFDGVLLNGAAVPTKLIKDN